MPKLVLVVEGHGDVDAFPNLVGKIGAWLGAPLFTTKPIRSKGWGSVKKPGGLERWIGLAASRPGCERVVVVVDLDDGCAVNERASVNSRIDALETRYGIVIDLCFCIREFEAWFLRCIYHFPDDLIDRSQLDTYELINNADLYRDAKGRLRSLMLEGYSESSDQSALIHKLECSILYDRDRSFKRFVKAVSGLSYETLAAA